MFLTINRHPSVWVVLLYMKLSQAIQEFNAWGSARYMPRTVVTYTGLLKKFLWYLGDIPISRIGIVNITEYHQHLKQKRYHDSTIAYSMISLRQFFKFLFLRRLVNWDYQLIPVNKYISDSYPPVEPEESKHLVDSIRVENFRDLRDKTLLSFLNASGVRAAELCALKAHDIIPEKGYTNIISKKNYVKRMVFWDARTTKLLIQYLAERKLWTNSDALWVATDRHTRGRGLTTRTVNRIVNRYKRPGSRISPHSFRHGLGMRAVKANVHPRYIQKILGHKHITSSQIYLDTHDEDVLSAYKKIVDLGS